MLRRSILVLATAVAVGSVLSTSAFAFPPPPHPRAVSAAIPLAASRAAVLPAASREALISAAGTGFMAAGIASPAGTAAIGSMPAGMETGTGIRPTSAITIMDGPRTTMAETTT